MIPLLSVPFQLFLSRMVAFGSSMTWADLSLKGLIPMLPRTHVNTKPLTKSSLPYILDILWRRSTWNPHTDLYTLSPPKEHCITGLRWWFSGDENATMMCDTRLPFGSRKSPSIFNRITQAVVRAMNSRGYDTLAYLDDFIVTGSDFHSCKAALDALIILLRSLGFQINWAKIQDPSQSVTFLEVNIDSVAGELSLRPEKLQEVQAIIRDFQRRCRASRKQLERLAGKLIWASRVTPRGRSHVKSVYSLILTLRLPGHKGLDPGSHPMGPNLVGYMAEYWAQSALHLAFANYTWCA